MLDLQFQVLLQERICMEIKELVTNKLNQEARFILEMNQGEFPYQIKSSDIKSFYKFSGPFLDCLLEVLFLGSDRFSKSTFPDFDKKYRKGLFLLTFLLKKITIFPDNV